VRVRMRVGFKLCLGFTLIAMLGLAAEQKSELPATPLPVGSAVVADFKGEVSIHSPQGGALTPYRGLVLNAESTIETANKSNILLNLQDGSQVLVKSRTRAVLKDPTAEPGFYLQLLIGKLILKVEKRLGNTPSFRMGTPSAVITVRGTRFAVEVTKGNRTYIEVFEGIVEVEGLGSAGRQVLIRPGFSTGIDADREPEEPREMNRDDFNRGAGNRQEGRESGQQSEQPEQQRNVPTEDEGNPNHRN
jgi:hypothetical protein